MNKKTFVSSVLGLTASLAAIAATGQSAYFRAITNLNPVGYWPMHEIEAPVPGDIETNYGSLGLLGTGFYPDWANANGNIIQRHGPGALAGDNDPAVQFTEGIVTGSGVSFTNGLFIPHTSPLTTLNPPFSVECWFYPTNKTTGVDVWAQNGEEGLNAGAEGGTTGNICGLRLVWVNATFVVYGFDNQFSLGTQNSNRLDLSTVVQPSNQWYHLVVTCTAQTNTVLYVNGASAASGTDAGKYSPDYWTPLSIGSGLGGTRAVVGSVDEFAVYTNALAQTDILNHYNAGLDPADYGAYFTNVLANNPVVYLRMDGPAYSPPPVVSWPQLTNYGISNGIAMPNGVYSPGTMPGIVPGPAASGGAPFAGLAVAGGTNVPQLSGVSSFADAGYATAYNPTGATPFSVSAMFRGNPTEGRLQTIVGHSANSWAINLNTLGKLQCQLGTNTASATTSVGVYNDGNWHQLVEVYTPASVPTVTGTNALYVDGVLDSLVSTVSTNGIGPGTNLDVMLGSDPQFTNSPAGVGRQFSGQVCEVALFTNALTASQVQGLYAASGVPLVLTQQPVSASANLNVAFTNTVLTTGSILGYQWYKNNLPLPLAGQTNCFGSTSPNLILSPVQVTDASTNYFVVVSNAFTSVTSQVVSLTVNSSPAILAQTSADVVYAGSNPTLFVNAVGTGTLHYQWTSNGAAIAGATSSSYVVVNAQAAATYGGTVSNANGTTLLTPVTMTVLPAPTNLYPAAVLASHPMDYWRMDEVSGPLGYDYTGGNNGIYTNTLLGKSGYTGLFNPQTDPNETAALFGVSTTNNSYLGSIPPLVNFGSSSNSSAEFSVEAWIYPNGGPDGAGLVSIGYGNGGEQFCLDLATTTNFLRFFVRNAGGTAYAAQSAFVPADGNWHHVVGVCDQANGFIYLYADGQLVASNSVPAGSGLLASTNTLVIGSRQEGPGTPFDYQTTGLMDDVAIYNYALSASSVLAHYYAAGIAPANLQVGPAGLTTNQNDTAMFTVAATGTPPLSYFWYDSGNGNTLISTNAVLTLNSVQSSDTYQVVVSNTYGTASTSVNLNVNSGPASIVSDLSPLLIDVPPGFPISFTVGVGGTAPFTYQWFINATNAIPGATNSTYSFMALLGTNTYNLWVTNQAGGTQTASSSTVTVEVGATPAVLGLGDGSGWQLNGRASFNGSPATLQLTQVALNQSGSAFYKVPQYIKGFLASFTYTPASGDTPNRADGATFTLQNSLNIALTRGGDAGGLGYSGIKPSVAFELDIFINRSGGPGINWETNGLTSAIGGLLNGGTGPVNINSTDPIGVTLYYDYRAGQLNVSLIDQTTSAAYRTNYLVGDLGLLLGNEFAYVGFTGGTGGADSIQTISNFAFSDVQTPALSIGPGVGGNVVIGWPGSTVTTNFVLQQSSVISGPWTNAVASPTTPTLENDRYQVTVSPAGNAQFYRLVLPNP
jgi:hypothetical protein